MRILPAVVAAVAAASLIAGAGTAVAEPSPSTTPNTRGGVAELDQTKAPTRSGTAARAAAAPEGGGRFVPLAPRRILDTRNGIGRPGTSPVAGGGTVSVDLNGIVPYDAETLVLNVTGTAPSGNTYVTVYPNGLDRPNVSTLNLAPGETRANSAVVLIGDYGLVNFFNNAGTTHLIADLAGYYTQSGGSAYNATYPNRLLDTRNGGIKVGPQGTVTVDFSSVVPADATAVAVNVTGVDATTASYVTAYPTGQARPVASSLNVVPVKAVPNQVAVALGSNRRVTFYNDNGSTHLIVDLAGYYASSASSLFYPTLPSRLFDTRTEEDGPAFGGGDRFDLPLSLNVPTTTALAMNLTGTNPTGNTYITLWPSGNSRPNASNLNLSPKQTAPNTANVALGTTYDYGTPYPAFSIFNNAGTTDVILDVFGYFAS